MKNTFGIDIIPKNEAERIEAVKRYNILDSQPEQIFDDVAALTAKIFNVPIALISIVDSERVFFKANTGMPGVTNVDRGVSLCSLAVLNDDMTVFDKPLEEPCLLKNPLVVGDFGLKFYAGSPIHTKDGFNIGTLCIIDKKQRFFSDIQLQMLDDISKIVMQQLELRLAAEGVIL